MQAGTKVHDAAGRHGVVLEVTDAGITVGWFESVEVVTADENGSLPLGSGVNVAAAAPADDQPDYSFGLAPVAPPPPAGAGQ